MLQPESELDARTREGSIAFTAFDTRIDHKLIAAETLRTSDAKQPNDTEAQTNNALLLGMPTSGSPPGVFHKPLAPIIQRHRPVTPLSFSALPLSWSP